MLSDDALAVLDFIKEPTVVLEVSGEIVAANRAARRLLGNNIVGRQLFQFISGSADSVFAYLRRCTGTTDPMPGSMAIERADGTTARFRCAGARLRPLRDTSVTRIALRLLPAEINEFSILAKQIEDANREIREHRQAEAALEESLRQNETLFRELQHRVKNNVQMLLGLLSAAKREAQFEETRALLDEIARRVMAVLTAQQLMYQSHDLDAVPAEQFAKALCEAISATHDVRIEVRAFEGRLANDIVAPLSLILNELLTNAFKHGVQNADGQVLVDLQRDENGYTLIVQDNGPGLPPEAKESRSSGLGLVRGLCRQIGGSLTIENNSGARCVVRVRSVET